MLFPSRTLRAACLFLLIALVLLSIGTSITSAADSFTVNPSACNELFGLPAGQMQRPDDKRVMSPEVCSAYKFLISRYTPGPRSSVGLRNPKVEGITRLNPDFAVALAKMLSKAPYMTIVSAYRTAEGQGSKNPQSNHTYGCAADLGYLQSTCSQVQCQWVIKNAPADGLHIRMKYSPEWNHIEPINVQVCRAGGPGGGITPGQPSTDPSPWLEDETGGEYYPLPPTTPTSGIADRFRQAIGMQTQPAPVGTPSTIAAPAATPAPSNLPLPTQSQFCLPEYTCSGSTLMYKNSFCAVQAQRECPGGCQSGACVGTTSPATGATTSSTTAQDTLSFLNTYTGATSTDIGTSTPLQLLLALTQNQSSTTARPTSTIQTPLVAPGSIASMQLVGAQQTFTSSDLNQNITGTYVPQDRTAVFGVLENMRQVLLRALDLLRPFRFTQQRTIDSGLQSHE